jgi:hypothetical protein
MPRRQLPRLPPEYYRGDAAVFWTHTIQDRATGLLDVSKRSAFREIVLHAAIREDLVCPIYTMMPDHVHMTWMGIAPGSDQRTGTSFIRSQSERHLAPAKWQHQPYDHLLREDERARGALRAICD